MKTAVQIVRRMKVEEDLYFRRGGGVEAEALLQRRISRVGVVMTGCLLGATKFDWRGFW